MERNFNLLDSSRLQYSCWVQLEKGQKLGRAQRWCQHIPRTGSWLICSLIMLCLWVPINFINKSVFTVLHYGISLLLLAMCSCRWGKFMWRDPVAGWGMSFWNVLKCEKAWGMSNCGRSWIHLSIQAGSTGGIIVKRYTIAWHVWYKCVVSCIICKRWLVHIWCEKFLFTVDYLSLGLNFLLDSTLIISWFIHFLWMYDLCGSAMLFLEMIDVGYLMCEYQ